MLFSGQKEHGELWQIWEIDLVRFKTRQITKEESNCTDPMYLPTGEIVYMESAVAETPEQVAKLLAYAISGEI